jgi:hypothetical protein
MTNSESALLTGFRDAITRIAVNTITPAKYENKTVAMGPLFTARGGIAEAHPTPLETKRWF